MEFQSILIKIEPEIEIGADGLNVSDCNMSQSDIKTEVDTQEEYSPSTTSFNYKSEVVDTFNNDESPLKSPTMEIEHIFDEKNLVDLSKLDQLLNQNKNTPECNKIKVENKEFEANRTCTSIQSPEDQVLQHQKKEIYRTIHMSNIDSYQTSKKFNLDSHIDSIHNDDKVKRNCQFCDKSFTSKAEISNHVLQQHKKEIECKIHKCSFCSYETTTKFNLKRHINLMHNEHKPKLNCQFCDKSFTKQNSLNDHLLKQHKKEVSSKIHKCSMCPYQTTIKCCLSRHIKSIHEHSIQAQCQFCNKTFATEWSHNDHVLKRHEGKVSLTKSKIHQCKLCPYQSVIKAYLDRHINSVHNEQRLKLDCHFCDKSFSLKYSLDDHLLKQHKSEIKTNADFITSKIHTCTICSYETTSSTLLNMHINSAHKEQKTKIKCQFCEKSFTRKPSLEDHLLKQHKYMIENDLKSIITNKIHKCRHCTFETTFKQCLIKHKCKSQT